VAGHQTACARGCPAAVSGSQTASLSKERANMQQQQQQQQSKMYTRGALQALAGKNVAVCVICVHYPDRMQCDTTFVIVFAGPNQHKITDEAAMAPYPDGTGVVLIGGSATCKDLYELKCSSSSCNWSLREQKLSVDRRFQTALLTVKTKHFIWCGIV
jgi:hypothetical protein